MKLISPLFRMHKWYLDCVSSNGEVVILYIAEMCWRGVSLNYSSVLASRGDAVFANTTLRGGIFRVPSPVFEVQIPKLGTSGVWRSCFSPLSQTIYANAEGAVRWNCFQPKANAQVQVEGFGEIEGLGYVERLDLTIPPWKLPMKNLQWGRYLSPTDSLVWIDWRGDFCAKLLFHNGEAASDICISNRQVLFDGRRLDLDLGCVLRKGRLGETIVPSAPVLGRLLPKSLSSIEESKWRSSGVLHTTEGKSNGWAIHEVVNWLQM